MKAGSLGTALALALSAFVFPAGRASAACNVRAVLAPLKTALQRAGAIPLTSLAESNRQLSELTIARRALNAAPQQLAVACPGDPVVAMSGQEAITVYHAWEFGLTANRALYLAGLRADCKTELLVVAGSAVTNGWGLLGRVVHELPKPDAFDATRSLLEASARRQGLVPLPALGDDAGLTRFQGARHIQAIAAAANLPPFCTRY